MNKYYFQYYSRTAIALENRVRQQNPSRVIWWFNFPTQAIKIAITDSVKEVDNINIHTGLNLTIEVNEMSLLKAEQLSREFAEMALTLASFVTLACCDTAEQLGRIEVAKKHSFPAKLNTKSPKRREIIGSVALIDNTDLQAIFDAFYNKVNPDPHRIFNSLICLRNGIIEKILLTNFWLTGLD